MAICTTPSTRADFHLFAARRDVHAARAAPVVRASASQTREWAASVQVVGQGAGEHGRHVLDDQHGDGQIGGQGGQESL